MTKATKPKLIYGVGINDAMYAVRSRVDGKEIVCPFYMTWTNMLEVGL